MPDEGVRALDPRVLWIWRIRAVVATAVLTAAAAIGAVALVVSGVPMGVAVVPVVVVLVAGGWAAAVLPAKAYERWQFVVGDESLELRHGVVFHSRSWVPWFRIQHVDIQQGPVERKLGLAHLVVHTASAATDATIPGIPSDEADEVRSLILSRIGADDGV